VWGFEIEAVVRALWAEENVFWSLSLSSPVGMFILVSLGIASQQKNTFLFQEPKEKPAQLGG
jgi:hypothetical protein